MWHSWRNAAAVECAVACLVALAASALTLFTVIGAGMVGGFLWASATRVAPARCGEPVWARRGYVHPEETQGPGRLERR